MRKCEPPVPMPSEATGSRDLVKLGVDLAAEPQGSTDEGVETARRTPEWGFCRPGVAADITPSPACHSPPTVARAMTLPRPWGDYSRAGCLQREGAGDGHEVFWGTPR